MRFEWDERKSASNLRKHGVDFSTASLVFEDPLQIMARDREMQGEERWHTVGMAGGILLLLVVHTFRDEEEDEVVRIISARKATLRERRTYEEGL